MMAKHPYFTIIKESGRAEFYSDRDYYQILSSVAHEYGSAGGSWDRPNMLLKDGKVVVPEKLADIAWKYGQRSRKLYDQTEKQLREEFKPDWLDNGAE